MSLFWDTRNKRPHYWTFVIFPLLAVIMFVSIYKYGEKKAADKEAHPEPVANELL